MSTDKELGEAWFGCQAEVKHLKAVLKLKETHILTLKEHIRSLKRKEMTRQQREKKRVAEKKEVKKEEKTLIYAGVLCRDRCSHMSNLYPSFPYINSEDLSLE